MNVLKVLAVGIFIAGSVSSEQIVNRCCRPPSVYSKISNECVPATGELNEHQTSIFQRDEELLPEFFILPKKLVKQLDGQNEAEVKFKILDKLPEGPLCSNGSFIATFCTALNASQCPQGIAPLLLSTRAELKVNNEYYSPREFCIIGADERTLEMRVCNPVCNSEVPCVRKCCDIDQVWDFNNGKPRKSCVSSGNQSWRPHFYLSENHPVPKEENARIRPHYFIAHPRSFYVKNKTTIETEEQRDSTSKKLSWVFRVGLNKNYYLRKSRYSWTELAEFWNSSCVDGIINSSYRPNSEFKGIEEEDVLIQAFPLELAQKSVTSPVLQISIYSVAMLISASFVVMTLVVHVLLWHRQTLHGWTLMSYCASLFFTFVFFVVKYVHSLTTKRGVAADGACVFIGVMVNYFFICTFCWLTVINFDLWLTFRKLQVRPKSSLGVRRYLAYTAFALTVPLVFIAVGLTLDALYVNEPETSWIIPEYGLLQCGPHPDFAQWVYQAGPAGILFLFNLVFFAATAFSIYKAQKGAKFATSSSSKNQDVASRAKLFGKLLIVMGVPYIFEFISALAEGFSSGRVSWYWQILDVLNVFQGVFIFIIFVCKKETLNALKEKYGLSKWSDITSSNGTGSSAMDSSTQLQMNNQQK